MNKVRRFLLGKGSTIGYAVMSAILAFVPEEAFNHGFIPCAWSEIIVITINRFIVFLFVLFITNLFYYCRCKRRKSITIADRAVTIKIEYGNLFDVKNGKIVVSFDECFTTTVGDRPGDIKPDSICGQYLRKYPIDDMQSLIDGAKIKSIGQSSYENKKRYEQGVLIPRDNFLLMAFAKLDKEGRGRITYENYLKCLNKLWEQIDIYHGTDDVYLPILGSKITRFNRTLSKQELLDIMIASYRLNSVRNKMPNTLHILCEKSEGFSLNNVLGVDYEH